jgi:hypothetical protein
MTYDNSAVLYTNNMAGGPVVANFTTGRPPQENNMRNSICVLINRSYPSP